MVSCYRKFEYWWRSKACLFCPRVIFSSYFSCPQEMFYVVSSFSFVRLGSIDCNSMVIPLVHNTGQQFSPKINKSFEFYVKHIKDFCWFISRIFFLLNKNIIVECLGALRSSLLGPNSEVLHLLQRFPSVWEQPNLDSVTWPGYRWPLRGDRGRRVADGGWCDCRYWIPGWWQVSERH